MPNKELALVVILYHPEPSHINNINNLSEHYDLLVIDNTPEPSDYHFTQGITLISLGENLGIAKALNIGIAEAKKNHSFALLLDQDSEPTQQVIQGLMSFYRDQKKTSDIALIAPSYYDKALQRDGVFITKGRFAMKKRQPIGETAISASYLITSGSLVNLSCYDHIGPMYEDLFIDFVDIEWCLRAKSKGYKILGLPWLQMEHEIGEKPVTFLGKKSVNHSPVRHYYYFRNVFMLLKMPHVPWQWKLAELYKLAPRFIVYATLTNNRKKQIRHMCKGIRHGITGVTGKIR